MNFIYCNSSCKHQKNGFCTLDHADFVSSEANDDCCFFEHKKSIKKGDYFTEEKETPSSFF